MRSCSNRVIELNLKMLILRIFVTKNDFLCDDDNLIVLKILLEYKVVLFVKI